MSAAKQRRRGRVAYARLFEQREREGLTYAELSASSGVPLSTLQRWGRRLGSEAASRPPFVEVLSLPTVAPEERVEVVLHSGRTLSLLPCPPFEGLAELVVLLESC